MASATVLLVHGAWGGTWVYWKLAPCLEARDVPWVGADLPSCKATDSSIGPADDAAYVGELIDGIDGPVVVVGKSYGGAVISGATGGRDDVAHLVYVAAFMPEAGEPFQRTTAPARLPEFAAGISALDDGRLELDAEVGARCAFTYATDADHDLWRRNRRPMSFGRDRSIAFDAVGWETIPSTYVVSSEDRCIDPSAQRAWATRATNVIERPYDHSPGLSRPEEIADLLAEIAADPR
jgi:pimeloyl-ACP methyl ester carboxylesterase